MLILFFSPVKNNAAGFIDQGKLLNSGYDQVLTQKIIGVSVFIFFILILILLFKGS
uniref:Preprotein-translocase subunit g n=1 Tax=Laurenciella marilzae TaxID=1413812 RepID=A0A1Z1M202_9FLOR|nr:preprotein-translocase subunit g [Laurenciella marilzae]ARW59813.1 preprotein-translocase subunit g [Laurenciella marilzae]